MVEVRVRDHQEIRGEGRLVAKYCSKLIGQPGSSLPGPLVPRVSAVDHDRASANPTDERVTVVLGSDIEQMDR